MTTTRVTIETPSTPNYLRTTKGIAIPIEDVSDRDLRGIAKNWTAILLLKARNRRKARRSA